MQELKLCYLEKVFNMKYKKAVIYVLYVKVVLQRQKKLLVGFS